MGSAEFMFKRIIEKSRSARGAGVTGTRSELLRGDLTRSELCRGDRTCPAKESSLIKACLNCIIQPGH